MPAHKFVDLSQADYGVALLNDGKYGHDISGSTMRLTLLRSPKTPDPLERPPGYQNPYADQGEHEFTYSIYPHRGDCSNGFSLRRGYELNYPLLSTLCTSHKGELKPQQSFITVKPDNLVLTVVKRAEENGDIILRLYEVNGQKTEAKLTLQRRVSRAWEVDMLEHRIRPLETLKNSVMFTVKPYEIFSLAIE